GILSDGRQQGEQPMPLNTVQRTTPWKFLLVLRLAAGLPLVYLGVTHLFNPADFRAILVEGRLVPSALGVTVMALVEILAGLLLMAGLLTRVGGMRALAVMMPAILLIVQSMERDGAASILSLLVFLMVAVSSAVLVLLGGGEWSMDERMCPCPTADFTGTKKR